MNYLSRKIDYKLKFWASSPRRKPLILRGARQVGKTASIKRLAQEAKLDLIDANFEKTSDLAKIFERDLNPVRIKTELEYILGKSIVLGKSLLFLDEIQSCPRAITALRYFYEDLPDLHIIAAGSLLEFTLGNVSIPVGRVEYELMYPMSFSEYLQTTPHANLVPLLPSFREHLAGKSWSIPETAAQKISEHLKIYFLLGGMPEAVATYTDSLSLEEVEKIQGNLIKTFRDDIRKYSQGKYQIENIERLFARIFKFVGTHIKYTEIGEDEPVKRTKTSLELLEKAMLVKLVKSAKPAGLPLGADASNKHFKCVFLDIGLGQRMSGQRFVDIFSTKDLLATYSGKLAEQFVGQQLLAEEGTGSEDGQLYCWIRPERSAQAEVDYVIARNGEIFPVEVKNSTAGRLKSLNGFVDKYGGMGICLQDRSTIEVTGNIIFMPLYTVL